MIPMRRIIKLLRSEGFRLAKKGRGSHVKYRKGDKVVTLAIHGMGSTVPPKTLKRIFEQAGIDMSVIRY